MKRYCYIFLFLLSLIPFTLRADPVEVDRHQMKLMLNDVIEKINQKQFDAIVPYLDKNAIITFYDGRTAVGTDAINNYLKTMVTGSTPVLKSFHVSASENAPAIIYPNNTAIAYGWAKNSFDFMTGEKLDVDGRWTVTLIKDSNNWKIIALHFSTNLFQNPLIDSIKHKFILFIIISLLIGLILGYLAHLLFSYQRKQIVISEK